MRSGVVARLSASPKWGILCRGMYCDWLRGLKSCHCHNIGVELVSTPYYRIHIPHHDLTFLSVF